MEMDPHLVIKCNTKTCLREGVQRSLSTVLNFVETHLTAALKKNDLIGLSSLFCQYA